MKNLINQLPYFYKNSEYVKQLMNAETKEVELLQNAAKDLIDNLFVQTATWGLAYFEKALGLKTDKNKSYEERRERIISKIRGSGTITIQMIKNTAKAFQCGDVDIIENASDYSFKVKFISQKGIPANLNDFKAMLDEIKPAHLNYSFEYSYNVWNFLKNNNLTWTGASAYTWNSIKVYENN